MRFGNRTGRAQRQCRAVFDVDFGKILRTMNGPSRPKILLIEDDDRGGGERPSPDLCDLIEQQTQQRKIA